MSLEEDRTVYIGNLDSQVDELLLYELIMQFAPVQKVKLPKDRVSGKPQGFAFVLLNNERDAQYVINLLNGISLYNKNIKVKKVLTKEKK